jgi:hypothetical protein
MEESKGTYHSCLRVLHNLLPLNVFNAVVLVSTVDGVATGFGNDGYAPARRLVMNFTERGLAACTLLHRAERRTCTPQRARRRLEDK